MKCKDCFACRKGFCESSPDVYVCIGVEEPFVINNIEQECMEYPDENIVAALHSISICAWHNEMK